MSMESAALLQAVLSTGHSEECTIDPTGSPAGATIRVLFSEPFYAQDLNTGVFQNTQPEFYARTSDLAGVTPEQTTLRILGADYTAHRIEPVPGGAAWRRVVLNEAS